MYPRGEDRLSGGHYILEHSVRAGKTFSRGVGVGAI